MEAGEDLKQKRPYRVLCTLFGRKFIWGPEIWISLVVSALVYGIPPVYFVLVVPSLPWYLALAGVSCSLLLILSYTLTAFMDPGIVRKQRADGEGNSSGDGLLEGETDGGAAGEAKLRQRKPEDAPPRSPDWDAPEGSMWCYDLEEYVKGYDHYCVFVNNSIGHNNLLWFYTFLAMVVITVTVMFATTMLTLVPPGIHLATRRARRHRPRAS